MWRRCKQRSPAECSLAAGGGHTAGDVDHYADAFGDDFDGNVAVRHSTDPAHTHGLVIALQLYFAI